MLEAVSNEMANDDEKLVPAFVCYIARVCKARFVGNRLYMSPGDKRLK